MSSVFPTSDRKAPYQIFPKRPVGEKNYIYI
jgi:hypothetical protein